MDVKIAPSVLAADFTQLGEQIREVERVGVDRLHIDVMDGRFVANISMGPLVLAALKRATALPLEVHLMIVEPERHFEAFAQAGASSLIVHQETCPHLHRSVQHIKGLGLEAGVALNPSTPLSLLKDILPDLDLALIMTVNPGFGGQQFIQSMLGKIGELRGLLDDRSSMTELEVDGGIAANTAAQAVEAGANVLVAGTAIFAHPQGISQGVKDLKNP